MENQIPPTFKKSTTGNKNLPSRFFIATLVGFFILGGCNSIRRLPGFGKDTPPATTEVADDYWISGQTVADFQWIEPVRCKASEIHVMVQIPGATTYRELNQYEFFVLSKGSNGGIHFSHRVDLIGTSLFISKECSAPIGTKFLIHSTLIKKENPHE